jgi:chromosome segregation ATPase
MLINSIKLKQGSDKRIEKLIRHYLENVVLVRDLEKAFEVSTRYKNITCITSKFQMVYPGSFITKAGIVDTSKKRIEPYRAME